MKQNRKAKFWIRFLAKLTDVVLLSCVLVLLLVPNITNHNGQIRFEDPLNFYIWSIAVVVYLIAYFYILPVCSNGYTLGSYLTKTKIRYTKSPWVEQAKREAIFSFIIVINVVMLMSIINHTLINQIVKNKEEALEGTNNWERLRISLYITITSIGILVELITGISIIINKGQGFNDSFSESQFIYVNRFDNIEKEQVRRVKKRHKPTLVDENVVEWVE